MFADVCGAARPSRRQVRRPLTSMVHGAGSRLSEWYVRSHPKAESLHWTAHGWYGLLHGLFRVSPQAGIHHHILGRRQSVCSKQPNRIWTPQNGILLPEVPRKLVMGGGVMFYTRSRPFGLCSKVLGHYSTYLGVQLSSIKQNTEIESPLPAGLLCRST